MMDPFSAPDAIILLLASGPVMRAALRDALESAGYLVVTANGLGQALDHLNDLQPDLLIIRPYVDSMPAHIAAANLRSKRPGLPVLVVGGFMDDDRINYQNAIEEFHIFPKAFSRDELLTKVREVLNITRRKG
jgi:DNA-binding NtrC family response regulator